MISSAVLEQPGRWRKIGIGFGLLVALAPAAPLLWPTVAGDQLGATAALGAGFATAVGRSLIVALAAAVVSLAIGLPTGILAALYDFSARRWLLGALAIPLLVPSFLRAIGLSMLRIRLGLPRESLLSGASGSVIAFAALGLPLVIYTTFVAARGLSKSQADAARIAGGETLLVRYAGRSCLPAAALAAMLAGVLTLSDPGPGQILGFSGVASEILISFSALYDFGLAAIQCVALSGIVLLLVLPVAWLAAPRFASGLLARDVDPAPLSRTKLTSWLGPSLLAVIILVTTALPLLGLIQPLAQRFPLSRAVEDAFRTGPNTLLYALTASVTATLLGSALAVCAGRETRLRVTLLAGMLVILSLPPSLGALGVVQAASLAPPWSDPFLRSRFTVGAVLALRFLPVATILAMRSLGTFSPSWASAAAVHGVPLSTYAFRVLGPMLRPAATLAALLVALLATAEVGTVLLLQPPGGASLPVTIFTVMANAPESLVASLCLIYIVGAVGMLMLGWVSSGRVARRAG